jgi:hypothetical protein
MHLWLTPPPRVDLPSQSRVGTLTRPGATTRLCGEGRGAYNCVSIIAVPLLSSCAAMSSYFWISLNKGKLFLLSSGSKFSATCQ